MLDPSAILRLTAACEIRALPDRDRAAVPMIAVSGSTRTAETHMVEEAGLTAFIGKPVNPEILLSRLLPYRPTAG
jgi:hypothetical protein